MTKLCSICSQPFEPRAHNGTMCSPQCVRIYRNEKQKEYIKEKNKLVNPKITECCVCGKMFKRPGCSSAKTCSKDCSKIRTKQRHKSYTQDKDYVEKLRSYSEKYRNSEKRKNWVKRNREKLTNDNIAYVRERKKSDKGFHMFLTMRAAISRMYKQNRHTKTLKDIVSYTPQQLKEHLEGKFKEGMRWDNYGRFGWNIDHIKPLTAFQFFDKNGNLNEDQLKESMSLENLQPLWWRENIQKGGANRKRN